MIHHGKIYQLTCLRQYVVSHVFLLHKCHIQHMNVSQHIPCAICTNCHRCQIWLHAALALLRGDVFSFFFTFRKTVVCPPWKTISDENFCGEAAREWNYESRRERERSKLDNGSNFCSESSDQWKLWRGQIFLRQQFKAQDTIQCNGYSNWLRSHLWWVKESSVMNDPSFWNVSYQSLKSEIHLLQWW